MCKGESTAVGVAYQYDFAFHRLLHSVWSEIPVVAKSDTYEELSPLPRETCNFACRRASDGRKTIPDAFGREIEINK